jgi:hypothetical protein
MSYIIPPPPRIPDLESKSLHLATMLACLSAAAAYTPPMSAVTVSRRAVAPSMQVSKKIWTFEGFDDSVLFEAREVSYKRPPVKILSRLNELKISTAVADAVRCCTSSLHTQRMSIRAHEMPDMLSRQTLG